MHRTLSKNVQAKLQAGTKLGTKFNNIKDSVKKSHRHSVVYYAKYPKPGCVEDSTDETGRI